MTRYPAGSTPPGDRPSDGQSDSGPSAPKQPNTGIVVAVVVAALLGIVALFALAGSTDFSLGGQKSAEDLIEPPSERRERPSPSPDRSGKADEDETSGRDPGSTGGSEEFQEVSCVFSGTSSLHPGLGRLPVPSEQKMELEEGSSFRCRDDYGQSSGTVSMSAKFPGLTPFRGTGLGPGLIEWDTLPLGAPGAAVDGPKESITRNEVELLYPTIIVWITIEDGPYAGLKGKLVLRDWELIRDTDGSITGLRFSPTDFTLAIP